MSFMLIGMRLTKVDDKLAIEHARSLRKTLWRLLTGDIKKTQIGTGVCNTPLSVAENKAVAQLKAVTELQAVTISAIFTVHCENPGIWN